MILGGERHGSYCAEQMVRIKFLSISSKLQAASMIKQNRSDRVAIVLERQLVVREIPEPLDLCCD